MSVPLADGVALQADDGFGTEMFLVYLLLTMMTLKSSECFSANSG